MPFKVKEILLIANYYDSYTIEQEGQFSGKIFGEYLQLNLFTAPVLLPWQIEKSRPSRGEKTTFRPDHHYGGSRQGNPAYYQPQYKSTIPGHLPAHACQQQCRPFLPVAYRKRDQPNHRTGFRVERFHKSISRHGQILGR